MQCTCMSELGEKRNAIASVVSGVLFFVGWWIIIGVYATMKFNGWYIVVGVVGTVSMFMVNAISNGQLRGDAINEGAMGTKAARLWLLTAFVFGFGALIAALWILFGVFVIPGDTGNDGMWPGLCLFFQNFFIFLSSLVYKFGRTEDQWAF